MLDFIVRHQESLLIALGTVASVIMVWVAVKINVPPAEQRRFALTGFAQDDQYVSALSHFTRMSPAAMIASPKMPGKTSLIIWAAIIVWFAFKIIANLRPIPPSIGLTLPAIIHGAQPNQSLIIFLHGWNGGDAATWQRFPQLAQHDRRFGKYDFLVINYPTYLVRRNLDITGLSEFIGKFIGKSLEYDLHVFERYRSITVIAHSMGGLVAREIAIQHDLRRTPGKFAQLVEIATPHDGANPAHLASALGISRETADDMSHGSRFLTALRTHWNDFAARPETFCIGSPQDMVVPAESAETDCSSRDNYLQWGHTEMVKPLDYRDYRYVIPTRYVK